MSRLPDDLRGGVRALLRAPGFSCVAVLTLALGVGVSSSAFSVVSGAIVRPTPWRDAERIAFVLDRDRDQPSVMRPLSYARFADVLAQSRSFEVLAAARGFNFVLNDGGNYESLPGAFVSPVVFSMLGLDLALGRPLTDDDARADAERAVVIDHATWTKRYASDPSILGRRVELEGQSWTVVGVLDAQSWFPFPGAAVLAALRPDASEAANRAERNLSVIGRLAEGAAANSTQTELDLVSERLSQAYPASDEPRWALFAQSVSEALIGEGAQTGIVVMCGALGFLLLIACANLTGLFLTRATARAREIAVRSALGAARRQIVSQLVSENLVLAAVAVPVALLVTRGTLSFFYAQVPEQVTGVEQLMRFDLPVWIFACVASLATVFCFGLLPALQATRLDLTRVLKEGDRGASDARGQWLRSTLVVAQLTLSVVLLVGASLLNRSFLQITRAEPGFTMENLFYAPVGLPEKRYAEPDSRIAFVSELTERLARIPGVAAVGVSDSAASAAGGPLRRFEVVGRSAQTTRESPQARWTAGSPGYLRALGLELRAGRYLEETDDAQGRRVAVVSQLFASAHVGAGESPLGQRIALENGTEIEIVGVVQDVKQIGMNATQRPQVYVPYAQQPSPFMQVVARTSVEPLSIGPAVRAEIQQLDPLVRVLRLTTALRERALSVWQIGFFGAVLALLGAVGLAMATVGVYGVVRYSTQQRTREFGIRSALGAEPLRLVLLVLRRTWLLTGIGLALGLLLSTALGAVLSSLLYEVNPFQPSGLLVPAALLGLSSLIAGALPAAQTARVDPVLALGAE